MLSPVSSSGVPIPSSADLARLVRSQRAVIGISQTELAKRAGVGRRFVAELESGKETIRLNEALKVLKASGLILVGQRQMDQPRLPRSAS